jgi:predicted cupin superfamily sugar epimerase
MTKVGSDLLSGCVPQFTAEHEVWMGAFFADKSVGDGAGQFGTCVKLPEMLLTPGLWWSVGAEPWLLTGAQLAPGFDPADSTLANRTDFIDRFPAWYHDLIIKLTPGQ